jgi:hypothetical protein
MIVTVLKSYISYFGKFSPYEFMCIRSYYLFPFLTHTPYRAHPKGLSTGIDV